MPKSGLYPFEHKSAKPVNVQIDTVQTQPNVLDGRNLGMAANNLFPTLDYTISLSIQSSVQMCLEFIFKNYNFLVVKIS